MDKLNKLLIGSGYAKIAVIGISNDDLEYHVPATYARATTYVYHKHGVPFIAKLVRMEDDFWKEPNDYYYAEFFFQRISTRDIYKKRYKPSTTLFSEDDCVLPTPGYNAEIQLPSGWRLHGGGRSRSRDGDDTVLQHIGVEPQNSRDGYTLESVVEMTEKVLEEVRPICREHFSQGFSVERLAPSYVFKGCENLFVSRFDVKYFRQIVPNR